MQQILKRIMELQPSWTHKNTPETNERGSDFWRAAYDIEGMTKSACCISFLPGDLQVFKVENYGFF